MSRLLALPCVTLLFLVSLTLSEAANWDYEKKGPNSWAKDFKDACAGKNQSPVDIKNSVYNPYLADFTVITKLSKHDYTLIIENDGHTLKVSFGAGLNIRMGPKDTLQYTAVGLHWHWGNTNNKGSEHKIAGRSYPLEGHLVFWNSRDYADFDAAKKSSGGLAVLAVLYEVSPMDNPLIRAIEPYLSQVAKAGSKVTATFKASDLDLLKAYLPLATRRQFYRYHGSLTTPVCSENVLWTVYARTIPVSARQLNLLRTLRYPSGKPEVNNYRPVQKLNGRRIERNF